MPAIFTVMRVLFAIAGVAWMWLLLGGSLEVAVPELCTTRLIAALPSRAEMSASLAWISPWTLAASWLLMLVAMMLPLLVGPLRHVRSRSLRRNRGLATGAFVLSYLSVWMLAGVVLIGLSVLARLSLGESALPAAAGLLLAAGWQAARGKQIALNRCHARPVLRPLGMGAVASAAGFGVNYGRWCVASCAPLMAAALLVPGWGPFAMVLAAIWIWAERLEPPRAVGAGIVLPLRAHRALRYHLESLASGRPAAPERA